VSQSVGNSQTTESGAPPAPNPETAATAGDHPDESIGAVACCQSCALPFDDGHRQLIAPEPDGRDSLYCVYCYHDGKFLQPDITIAEIVEVGVEHLGRKIGRAAARQRLAAFIPTLARWRQGDTGS
jgi:hypothetical protein